MLVSHKLNQHFIIDMMPIMPVTGQVTRLKGLTRLWSDFRDYWDRRDTQSQSASEVPTPPAAPPKQALPNFRQGTRNFLVLMRSMGRTNRNNGKAATNIQLEAPGLAAEAQEDHGTRKAIVPIPKNAPGELPIKPEKPKNHLLANTAEQQQRAMKRSGSSKRKQKRAK